MKKMFKTLLPAALTAFALSGCVIGAAVDLAATTVLTAGKLAVKATGAAVDAVIPDKKDQDKKEREQQKNRARDGGNSESGGWEKTSGR